jgi:Fe-S-cluster containining protein
MKWSCLRCGSCCHVFSEFVLGYKCPRLNSDNSCGSYETRPKPCRIDVMWNLSLDKDEYLMARCKLVRILKEWKDEFGNTESVKFILKSLANSGVI